MKVKNENKIETQLQCLTKDVKIEGIFVLQILQIAIPPLNIPNWIPKKS